MADSGSKSGKFTVNFLAAENLQNGSEVFLQLGMLKGKIRSRLVTVRDGVADFTGESFESTVTLYRDLKFKEEFKSSGVTIKLRTRTKVTSLFSPILPEDTIAKLHIDFSRHTKDWQTECSVPLEISSMKASLKAGLVVPVMRMRISCSWNDPNQQNLPENVRAVQGGMAETERVPPHQAARRSAELQRQQQQQQQARPAEAAQPALPQQQASSSVIPPVPAQPQEQAKPQPAQQHQATPPTEAAKQAPEPTTSGVISPVPLKPEEQAKPQEGAQHPEPVVSPHAEGAQQQGPAEGVQQGMPAKSPPPVEGAQQAKAVEA